jgi:hypothetical protein
MIAEIKILGKSTGGKNQENCNVAMRDTSPTRQQGKIAGNPSLALRASPSYAVARVGLLSVKDLRSFLGQSLHYI